MSLNRTHKTDAKRLRYLAKHYNNHHEGLAKYEDLCIFDYWVFPNQRWNTTAEWFSSPISPKPTTAKERETEYILILSLAAILAEENNL